MRNKKNKIIIIRIVITIILMLISLIANDESIKNILLLITYIFIGFDVLLKSIRNMFRGNFLDENFLMSIATIGAFFINERAEAVFVMLFYQIGEYFQNRAVEKWK